MSMPIPLLLLLVSPTPPTVWLWPWSWGTVIYSSRDVLHALDNYIPKDTPLTIFRFITKYKKACQAISNSLPDPSLGIWESLNATIMLFNPSPQVMTLHETECPGYFGLWTIVSSDAVCFSDISFSSTSLTFSFEDRKDVMAGCVVKKNKRMVQYRMMQTVLVSQLM